MPFYICWFITAAMFIHISPGLRDPSNNIPQYQVIMAGVYLIYGFIYPIYISVLLANQIKEVSPEDNTNELIPLQHEIFTADESLSVLLPWMILFGIHICAILPQFLCEFNRKLEMIILVLVVISLMFENWRYESSDNSFRINQSELLDSSCSLLIQLTIWLGIYILNFWPWKQPLH